MMEGETFCLCLFSLPLSSFSLLICTPLSTQDCTHSACGLYCNTESGQPHAWVEKVAYCHSAERRPFPLFFLSSFLSFSAPPALVPPPSIRAMSLTASLARLCGPGHELAAVVHAQWFGKSLFIVSCKHTKRKRERGAHWQAAKRTAEDMRCHALRHGVWLASCSFSRGRLAQELRLGQELRPQMLPAFIIMPFPAFPRHAFSTRPTTAASCPSCPTSRPSPWRLRR